VRAAIVVLACGSSKIVDSASRKFEIELVSFRHFASKIDLAE
jgi:hypothetical protein